jgi:hypothetical protein
MSVACTCNACPEPHIHTPEFPPPWWNGSYVATENGNWQPVPLAHKIRIAKKAAKFTPPKPPHGHAEAGGTEPP